jgi:hypothetical protein
MGYHLMTHARTAMVQYHAVHVMGPEKVNSTHNYVLNVAERELKNANKGAI